MPRRYRNCSPFLNREVHIFLPTLRAIIPVGNTAYRWCLAFAEPDWPPIMKPLPHYAMIITKKMQKKWEGADSTGLPTKTEFAEFAEKCNPGLAQKHETKLLKRHETLLKIYRKQIAKIKAKLETSDSSAFTGQGRIGGVEVFLKRVT